MKLADTDAMLRRLCAQCCGCEPDECGYIDEFKKERCKVGQFIEAEPTVDAEPVRHGYWIDKPNPQWPAYDIRSCSACGWSIPKSKLRGKDLDWKRCPACGAKMND